jgi:flagellar basal-body rod modification protein FlgD
MATSGVTGTSGASSPPVVDKDKIGVAGLTSDSFLKLLIAQLQNQDPTAPVGNEEILSQLSQMRSLQSNVELSDTLKGFASGQQITTGSAFLGKTVTGKNQDGDAITGVADRVFIENNETMLGIGNDKVKVSSVTEVKVTPAAA